MELVHENLATRIRHEAASCGRDRFLVAVAGAPGSGKTTTAVAVAEIINSIERHETIKHTTAAQILNATTCPRCVVVSMDGFHHPRSYLDTLPNSAEAYARRGASWTFDAEGVLKLVCQLRESADIPTASRTAISAPTFDHALKDPAADGILIPPETQIIILEGNYLLLDNEVWRDVSPLVDLRIFVDVDPAEARTRVAARHVKAGIESNLGDAERRFDTNDALNGDLVRAKLMKPDIIIQSVHK